MQRGACAFDQPSQQVMALGRDKERRKWNRADEQRETGECDELGEQKQQTPEVPHGRLPGSITDSMPQVMYACCEAAHRGAAKLVASTPLR